MGSKALISSMLFDHCLDKDAALMRLLPDAAEAQVFSECVGGEIERFYFKASRPWLIGLC